MATFSTPKLEIAEPVKSLSSLYRIAKRLPELDPESQFHTKQGMKYIARQVLKQIAKDFDVKAQFPVRE